jgi:hypothetical protein
MRRVFTSLFLVGSLVACSGGSGSEPDPDWLDRDRAPSDSQQEAYSDEGAVSDSQQTPYSDEGAVSDSQEQETGSEAPAPGAACVGTTSALESILLLSQVACAKAAACGLSVPTMAEVESIEGDAFEALGFWPLLCVLGEACAQDPEECQRTFAEIGLTDSQVCPEQVLACWNAVADMLGCEPTEQQTELVDENLPAACEGVIPEAEQPDQRPEDMPQPGGDGTDSAEG